MNANRYGSMMLAAALGCCSADWAAAQSSAHYALPLSTFNAGVGAMASTNFHLSSSLGGPFFSGPDASTNFDITPGLFGPDAVTGSPPSLVGALSRKVHGAAGTFDLPLGLVATNPTTEPRQGPTQTIVLTFNKAITAATATIAEGTAIVATPTFSGNNVIIGLTGVTDRQYVTVSLTNVASADGGTGGSGSVRLGFLLGDVSQNRVVSLSDLAQVNAQLAQLVTAANFLKTSTPAERCPSPTRRSPTRVSPRRFLHPSAARNGVVCVVAPRYPMRRADAACATSGWGWVCGVTRGCDCGRCFRHTISLTVTYVGRCRSYNNRVQCKGFSSTE